MDFKVNDYVRIVRKWEHGETYDSLNFLDTMENTIGRIGRIISITYNEDIPDGKCVVYFKDIDDHWTYPHFVLEKVDPPKIPKFKPLEKVLVRDSPTYHWQLSLYSHYRESEDTDYRHATVGGIYKECILYKGNEALLGTTNSPKED